MFPIRISGPYFQDEHHRTLLLRGVNLGGSSKVPFPNGATHIREGFFDHRSVSFVGRPFPLEEADEHFARLRSWGFTFLRFLITWEAVEHAGPGLYDEAYLDYLYRVVRKAADHGLTVLIDPHQDVWSRFSGGDGAPGWTFEVVGMDITRFAETGAAIVHATHGDPFPQMVWANNYGKLAAATMFTLFFGGNDFAPQTRVDGEPIQAYLQRHYLAAVQQVAARLRDLPHVVGYGTLNEPSAGFIGHPDLGRRVGVPFKGDAPTPWQAILLGAGFPQEVDRFDVGPTGIRKVGRRRLNPAGVNLWRGGACLWRENGVWDLDAAGRPQLLRPGHFAQAAGRPIDFHRDYLRPFANHFAQAVRMVDPAALIFVEGEALPAAHLPWEAHDAPNVVHAPHWYDDLTLVLKTYLPWLAVDRAAMKLVVGRRRVARSFAAQLAALRAVSEREMGGVPTLLGEFGVPFDMEKGRALRTGDFSRPAQALDRTFRALEANLLSGTLWNYTADNTHERGDQWNGEDLSIYSRDGRQGSGTLDDGGRALEAAVRPYARATAGRPLRMAFDYRRGRFEFEFRHDPAVTAPTEFYLPRLHYPNGCLVEVSDGRFELDSESQTLRYWHTPAQEVHRVWVMPG